MTRIVVKESFSPGVWHLVVEAPEIAVKSLPGQFVICRVSDHGERIPLTVADTDPAAGTISMVIQEIGKSTAEIGTMKAGDSFADLVGPLGEPTEIKKYGTVACVGGGVGVAALFPIARGLAAAGNRVVTILGARSRELLFWEDRFKAFSDRLYITTDDGTAGRKGFVTDQLKDILDSGTTIDRIWAVGPVVMMQAVGKTTAPYQIPTIVSLNPVMVDGTGMCGACRVTIGGRTRFVCIEGPEFEASEVDFGELRARLAYYRPEEKKSYDCFCQKMKRLKDE